MSTAGTSKFAGTLLNLFSLLRFAPTRSGICELPRPTTWQTSAWGRLASCGYRRRRTSGDGRAVHPMRYDIPSRELEHTTMDKFRRCTTSWCGSSMILRYRWVNGNVILSTRLPNMSYSADYSMMHSVSPFGDEIPRFRPYLHGLKGTTSSEEPRDE